MIDDGVLNPQELPPPSDAQRARGWRYDYSSCTREHSDALKQLFVDKQTIALDKFVARPTQTDAQGNHITLYDFTGGAKIRQAKQMARNDELEHEQERLKRWRDGNDACL
jgi:hypothetical protein